MFVPASLRYWRTQRILSQDELAKAARIGRNTIINLEAGKQHPRPQTLRRLARALKIDPVLLLSSGDTHTT